MQKLLTEQWIDNVWEKLDKKLSRTAVSSRDKLPYTTLNGEHDNRVLTNPNWWANGFWAGLMWLMYAGTKKDDYKTTAERAEELLDSGLFNFEGTDHDVGFMWHISSGINYRLTGNEKSKNRALYAAANLASRYNIKGGFIRAWNEHDGIDAKGWSIIDCVMNIPLLYWASRHLNDDRFRYIAESHADMVMRDHVRPDGSVHHIVVHDPVTGEVLETPEGQGYAVNSAWSRGHAWAIYGFVLSYIHTNEVKYLDTAKRCAHYFIAALGDDYIPRCDFRAPEEPVIYDATAGAIAACGLLEISKNVPELEKKIYFSVAEKLIKTLEERCCNWDDGEDSILQLGTGGYHKKSTHHIPIIYGDYFFAEAIYKLKGFKMLFW